MFLSIRIQRRLKEILEEQIFLKLPGQWKAIDFLYDGSLLHDGSDDGSGETFQGSGIFVFFSDFLQQGDIFLIHLDVGAGIEPRLLPNVASGFEKGPRNVVVSL